MNPNRAVTIDKVVVHMGVGEAGDRLVNAERIVSEITGNTPVRSVAKQTLPAFGIRKGSTHQLPGDAARETSEEFLATSIKIAGNRINSRAFDKQGNFSFGIEEHTDYRVRAYDPKVGIFGLDVTVVLRRNGARIARRHIQQKKLPSKQMVTVDDAKLFLRDRYNVEVQ
jgi:large subunit ribosomal protein L5